MGTQTLAAVCGGRLEVIPQDDGFTVVFSLSPTERALSATARWNQTFRQLRLAQLNLPPTVATHREVLSSFLFQKLSYFPLRYVVSAMAEQGSLAKL